MTFLTCIARLLSLVASLSIPPTATVSYAAGHDRSPLPLTEHGNGTARLAPASALTVAAQDASDFALEIEALINQYRASQGVAPLDGDDALRGVAQEHNTHMEQSGDLCHRCPGERSVDEQLSQAGYPAETGTIGQVLAFNYRSPAAVVEGWMQSASHRRSLLAPEIAYVGCAYLTGAWGALTTCELVSD